MSHGMSGIVNCGGPTGSGSCLAGASTGSGSCLAGAWTSAAWEGCSCGGRNPGPRSLSLPPPEGKLGHFKCKLVVQLLFHHFSLIWHVQLFNLLIFG